MTQMPGGICHELFILDIIGSTNIWVEFYQNDEVRHKCPVYLKKYCKLKTVLENIAINFQKCVKSLPLLKVWLAVYFE